MDMNHTNHTYQKLQKKIASWLIREKGVFAGRVDGLRTDLAIFRYGDQTILMQKLGVTFMNTALLFRKVLNDLLKLGSLFTTEMELKTITELRIWNYLFKKYTGVLLDAHIVRKNLQ